MPAGDLGGTALRIVAQPPGRSALLLAEPTHTFKQSACVQRERFRDPLEPFERRNCAIVLDISEERDRNLGTASEGGERQARLTAKLPDSLTQSDRHCAAERSAEVGHPLQVTLTTYTLTT
jgi:hypothetical protein